MREFLDYDFGFREIRVFVVWDSELRARSCAFRVYNSGLGFIFMLRVSSLKCSALDGDTTEGLEELMDHDLDFSADCLDFRISHFQICV